MSVKRDIERSADEVWAIISDFADTSWMPAGTEIVVEGEGPGMARLVTAGETRIREQLESTDDETRTLVYTIPENVPFPVTDYRSTMRVREKGTGSELEWSCTFEPIESEEKAVAIVSGMYDVMIGWVADRAVRDR